MTQYLRPSSDIASSGVNYSSGSSVYSLIDEVTSDDADYIYLNASGAYFTVGLETPPDNPSSDLNHVLHIRGKYSTGLPASRSVSLLQGTSEIASFTYTPTTSFANYTYELTEAQAAQITDYSALRIKVSIGTSGFNYFLYVSQAYLEVPSGIVSMGLEMGCAF